MFACTILQYVLYFAKFFWTKTTYAYLELVQLCPLQIQSCSVVSTKSYRHAFAIIEMAFCTLGRCLVWVDDNYICCLARHSSTGPYQALVMHNTTIHSATGIVILGENFLGVEPIAHTDGSSGEKLSLDCYLWRRKILPGACIL